MFCSTEIFVATMPALYELGNNKHKNSHRIQQIRMALFNI